MVKRHLPLHKTQSCLGGKVNTLKNPVESLPRNGKMRAGFAREVPRNAPGRGKPGKGREQLKGEGRL